MGFFVVLGLIGLALAQYRPPQSELNLTTIKSPLDGNITITYKSPPPSICETAYDWQNQYTGWVNIPGDYPSNTFFWFIEAREPTEQVTLWLNGGPGSSSMVGMWQENGPCEVVDDGMGGWKTRARAWGWDRGSHLVFVDQPNQVGFSYDEPTEFTIDLLNGKRFHPMSLGIPYGEQPKYTILNGTLSSSNPNNTANTTALSALAVYHAMQGILTTLPTLPNLNLSSNTNELSINLFAESYGGKYAPAFASLWSEENAKLRYRNNSQTIRGAVEIKLKSVGIINGCVDDLIAGPYYAQMANNNTYALRSVSDPLAASMNGSFYAPSGCRDQILECRSLATSNDPDGNGDDISTNLACLEALSICYDSVIGPYAESGRSMYDIAQFLPESFPSNAYLEYLNSKEVLDGIGSPVNFTVTSSTVVQEFTQAGDHQRDGFVPDYAALLAEGIRVSFIYGDRDYICNWLGGEAISLAVAKHPPSGLAASEYGQHFPAAGYAPIIVNDSYIGGEVRQFANLSFARIYDAGHLVPSYQPETAFQVFARVIHGLDIGTGAVVDEDFSTSGPPHTRQEKRKLPPSLENVCWIRDIANSCTPDQAEKIREGKGTVVGGVFYEDSEQASKLVQSQESARSTKTIGGGTATVVEVTTVTGSTPVLTGMYTATSTPDSGSASMALPFGLMVVGGVMAVWMGV